MEITVTAERSSAREAACHTFLISAPCLTPPRVIVNVLVFCSKTPYILPFTANGNERICIFYQKISDSRSYARESQGEYSCSLLLGNKMLTSQELKQWKQKYWFHHMGKANNDILMDGIFHSHNPFCLCSWIISY